MLKIGITGGMGAGKSVICDLFKVIGIPVFNSDITAKIIIKSDVEIKKQLIKYFSCDIYLSNGEINKPLFSDMIFNNKEAISFVNSIVHPAVHRSFNRWIDNQKGNPYVLYESAIIYESSVNLMLDKVIVVSSPIEIRIKRVMERDSVTLSKVEERIKNQWSQNRIVELADYLIVNDNIKLIIPQVLEVHNEIVKQLK